MSLPKLRGQNDQTVNQTAQQARAEDVDQMLNMSRTSQERKEQGGERGDEGRERREERGEGREERGGRREERGGEEQGVCPESRRLLLYMCTINDSTRMSPSGQVDEGHCRHASSL